MKCFCCSEKDFADCCQLFLDDIAKPLTAVELMRSRYSAYATVNIDYLIKTIHPSTRKFYESESIKKWAETNDWQKLEIILTEKGTAKDKNGIVEFKAYYLDSDKNLQTHHEISNFKKELGKWFFVDGKVLDESD